MRSHELEPVLAEVPIVGILRGLGPDAAVGQVNRLLTAGIRVIEVTIQQLDAVPTLEAVVAVCRARGAVVAAGSVLTPAHLEAALVGGVDFTVAPGLDLGVLRAAEEHGIAHIPGVATATEITAALQAGVRLLKAFPARQLTPAWITAMHGPFPEARFVATGGLGPDDLAAWQAAGCDAIGVNAKNIPSDWRSAR